VVRLDRRADGGAVALLVAVLATVLFGFAAIVVDLGYARNVKSDAQSAVDAASLAGASILARDSSPSAPFVDVTDAIKASALANFGTTGADWAACAATPPSAKWKRGGSGTDCILFNNNANNPSKLQVVLPFRHVDSFFGGLVGYNGADISARAQATIREVKVPGCALCVQGPLDTSGDIAVDGGSTGGSSSAINGRVRTGGSITVQDPGSITFETKPIPAGGRSYSPTPPLIRPVTDPFAGDPMPSGDPGSPLVVFPVTDPPTTNFVRCGPGGVLTQGTYRNILVTATATDPCSATGVIVVTGQLRVISRGYLAATASVIQLSCGTRANPSACAPSTGGGRLRIDPLGQLSMSVSFPSEFSVVADPNNTSAMTINGTLSVDQAVYGRSTAVTVGSGASLTAFGRISVGPMTIDSGGEVTVNAAGEAAIPGPPFVGLYR
jgi:Putative Flp pilus-assembly TadE/G-like